MQGGKESVFVVRLGGGIDLPSSWLTLFFRQSKQCIVSLPHTHALIPKALPPFLQFPLSLPHCPKSISVSSSCCLKPQPPTHTHTNLAPTAIRWNICFCFSCSCSFPQVSSFPMGTIPAWLLTYTYFCVYDGGSKVQAAHITTIRESIQINHITNKLNWEGCMCPGSTSVLRLPDSTQSPSAVLTVGPAWPVRWVNVSSTHAGQWRSTDAS